MTKEEAITILNCERPYASCGCSATDEEIEEAFNMAIEALKLIPDNATNIGVIKSLFPNGSQVKGAGIFIMDDKKSNLSYDIEWGNAPYKFPNFDKDVESKVSS